MWGGDNAGAIVTDSSAHVHIGCTAALARSAGGRTPCTTSGRPFTTNRLIKASKQLAENSMDGLGLGALYVSQHAQKKLP